MDAWTKRLVDLDNQGIDLLVRDNNRLDEFRWERDPATLDETLRESLGAFSTASQLWVPDYWTVELSPFAFGIPGGDGALRIDSESPGLGFKSATRVIHAELDKHARSDPPWSLHVIQTSPRGWNRLVLPDDVAPSESWTVVDPDGIIRTSYEMQPAPGFAGHRTIWIHLTDANPATHFSLVIETTGEVRMLTSLGISFFNPDNDARAAAHPIQGAQLQSWRAVNLELLNAVISDLEQAGWAHRRHG